MRNWDEFRQGRRLREECIPENLEEGKIYQFLKKEQRNYWLHGEIPLVETAGGERLSRPKASIAILEATHFLRDGELFTKGLYKVMEIFDDEEVHFEGFGRIK